MKPEWIKINEHCKRWYINYNSNRHFVEQENIKDFQIMGNKYSLWKSGADKNGSAGLVAAVNTLKELYEVIENNNINIEIYQ